jgi:hypothetical protein
MFVALAYSMIQVLEKLSNLIILIHYSEFGTDSKY